MNASALSRILARMPNPRVIDIGDPSKESPPIDEELP